MMIILSSYLANQANSLVSPPLINIDVPSLQAAISTKVPICALTGANPWCMDCAPGSSTAFSIVNSSFPNVKLLPVDSGTAVDLMIAMNAGKCKGAVMTQTQWDFVRNTIAGNPTCDAVQTTLIIRPVSGGFPLLADYGKFNITDPANGGSTSSVRPHSRCVSAAALVFSALLSDFRGDGSLASLYQRAQANYWTQTCGPLGSSGTPALPGYLYTLSTPINPINTLYQPYQHTLINPPYQYIPSTYFINTSSTLAGLTIGDMGGTFFMYGISVIFAFMIILFGNPVLKRYKKLQKTLKLTQKKRSLKGMIPDVIVVHPTYNSTHPYIPSHQAMSNHSFP